MVRCLIVNQLQLMIITGILFFYFTTLVSTAQNNWYDDAAHGVRLSANDQFSVFACNLNSTYLINYTPFTANNMCVVNYSNENYFVYSVSVMKFTENDRPVNTMNFLQVAENIDLPGSVFISIVTVEKLANESCQAKFEDFSIWNESRQEYMNIKIDQNNTYAYVFADSFLVSFDVQKKHVQELVRTGDLNQNKVYLTRSFDLVDDWSVSAVLQKTKRFLTPTILLIQLQPFKVLFEIDNYLDLEDTQYTAEYSRNNEMSISISPSKNQIIVGNPINSQVTLFDVNTSRINDTQRILHIRRKVVWPSPSIGFGRTVLWIDSHRVGVNLFRMSARSWSISELWVFDVNTAFEKPLFLFPNNQQILFFSKLPLFLHMTITSNHLWILTEQRRLILITKSPPGLCSTWLNNTSFNPVVFLSPMSCVAGSYKNTSGIGPCTVCPPHTKNNPFNQSKLLFECIPCLPGSFCPLAASEDVNITSITSYTYSYSYPDTPTVDNYDDLLLDTMFSLTSSSRCIVISPLFWTLIVVSLCVLTWLIINLMKYIKHDRTIGVLKYTKIFFKHFDIIGEGEKWIGGIFSFAMITLIAFAIWFATLYIDLYPIETSGNMKAACDETIRNARFDNALQLPLPSIDGQRWPIFDMLDNQKFTLDIDLINTQADCQSITAQVNRLDSRFLRIPVVNCRLHPSSSAIRSFSIQISRRVYTVQVNISANYFIGGVRLCFRGDGYVNGTNTLHSLDACQFYSTDNQTIGSDAVFPVTMIQTVNQTKPLANDGDTYYSGRWAISWDLARAPSNRLIYEQYGEYLRYATNLTVLTIIGSELPFYLQNNQQPIIRKAELVFHTLFFSTVVLELFGLSFLLIKLMILPMIKQTVKSFRAVASKKDGISRSLSKKSYSIYFSRSILPQSSPQTNSTDQTTTEVIATEGES